MPHEVIVLLGQFGAAGLIGLLWVLERRHATVRDRQLAEAHDQLRADRADGAALLNVIRDNTRAIASLEHSQRELGDLIRAMAVRTHSEGASR